MKKVLVKMSECDALEVSCALESEFNRLMNIVELQRRDNQFKLANDTLKSANLLKSIYENIDNQVFDDNLHL